MVISPWKPDDYFKKVPPANHLTHNGRRGWDIRIDNKVPATITNKDGKATFTMPSFGRHGRWGNMVFQYLFMRVLGLNNNRNIELNQTEDWIKERMNLYKDMQNIPAIKSKSDAFLINDYQYEIGYIPRTVWRLSYVSMVRHQKCYVLKDADAAINEPLPLLAGNNSMEVEGAYLLGPPSYQNKHKDFIQNNLFKPNEEFENFIQNCLEQFGEDKTIIGIHIRRGDFIQNPLGQQFDLPVPTKHIVEWLGTNLTHISNPVLYVSSNDPDAYAEIAAAGFEVYHQEKILPESNLSAKYKTLEQVDWEIMRHCDVLLTSNSTFSFSAALLNTKGARCYRFIANKKTFEEFIPWDNEPLQMYGFSRYVWSTLFSRFALVMKMVSFRRACSRLLKDVKFFYQWKKTKVKHLYYIHGLSLKYIIEMLNLWDLVRVTKKGNR